MPDRARVVIIGGGFAGLNAAKDLAHVDVDVTLIDRRNFHLFTPLLYQVASAALNPSDIAYPIRTVFRGQPNIRHVVMGEVTDTELEERTVEVDTAGEIGFDYLVVASGATHSYFGNDEWAEFAPGLKTIEDALYIRRRVLSVFEKAERDPSRAAELLTFVVVGAGPTGVEMAGAMAEIAIHSMEKEFRRIDPKSARIILVEGAEDVLPVYPDSLSVKAQRQLESMGVEVRVGTMVESIDANGVTLDDGTRIDSETVIWAAGVKASPLGAMLGAETDKTGRVVVDDDLSVPGHPNVFVAGDLASVEDVPGVAPAAMQMGSHAAKLIRGDLIGKERKPFRYRDKGSLATIGRARGVADFGAVKFGGFAAWFAWLAIHIWYLLVFRNKFIVFVSSAWAYLSFRRGARIITGQPRPD